MKPSFAIVGCGKVGGALAEYLSIAGYKPVGITCRNQESAQKAGLRLKTDYNAKAPWEITRKADLVFITTPDGVISQCCEELAQNKGFSDGSVVLHCSGALPSTILASAKAGNVSVGSMHPLQSFASSKFAKSPFKDIIMAVEGDEKAVTLATEITEALGARPIKIKTEAKVLYHASAVAASNYLVTLLDASFKLMEKAGVSRKDAFDVLKPLLDGTFANIERVGIPEALTGPVARGDVVTVTRHVSDIREKIPELLDFYKVLGLHTVNVAEDSLSQEQAKAFRELFT